MVADLRMPPQTVAALAADRAVQAGSASPARTRSCTGSAGWRSPQLRHITSSDVPWISTMRAGSLPAFWCSPSMFCVTSRSSRPLRSRSTRARCPAFGSADHIGEVSRFCHDRARSSGSDT